MKIPGEKNGELLINAACKMCKLCVKKGRKGAIEYVEEVKKSIDKDKWKGIAVYVDHIDGIIIHPVYALMMGSHITEECHELLHYNVDKVYVYDQERPAFGGNIMAQILTPNHRPQMATVRYKVMDATF